MEKKFVIHDIISGECFAGSDLDGAYFGTVDVRKFDAEQQAQARLDEEYALFPQQFKNRLIEIKPVFAPKAP